MSTADLVVVLAGVAAIAWVNWYFFFAERSAAIVTAPSAPGATVRAAATATIPEVLITVLGGYDPGVIRVPARQPVRLVFLRKDTSSCSEEIVLPDFGIRRFLPTGQKVAIEVTPPKPGHYELSCGMGMLHGALIAEEPAK